VVINVRQTIVLVLLVSMLGGFGALGVMRQRTTHLAPVANQTAPLPSASAKPIASTATNSSAIPNPSAASSSQAPPTPSGSTAVADAGPVPAMDRPLSVVALGWDLGAPGILANDGIKPNPKSAFAANNLEVRLSVSNAMSNIEEALARGGGDASGADIAIVSLSNFVEAYERLRALSPEVFFVVGFSHGRDVLAGKTGSLPTGSIKGNTKLVGTRGTPSTFLGLFLLDIAGVAPTEVEMVTPGEREEKDASFFAFERGDTRSEAGRKMILTTADTPRFLPIVAIAPHGLIADKERAVSALTKGWLDGMKKLGTDPPGGARIISALDGAPEPLALLRQLGEMETATIGDNVHMMGLSGRSALTLPVLFQRTWQLYRGVSFVSTPPPETLPIATSIVTALARSNEALANRDNHAAKGDFKEGKETFVVYRQDKLDEESLVNTIGLLAAVFERSVLRVSVNGQASAVDTAKTKKVVDAAEGQFGVESGRLVVATKSKARGAAIEVLALP
jgi:hypothetical protein